jgi:hypothetical protein
MLNRLFDRSGRRRPNNTSSRRTGGWHPKAAARRSGSLASTGISLEPLEGRAMLANFSYAGTTLTIDLSDDNDVLTLTATGTNSYVFTNNKNFKGVEVPGLTGNGTKTLTITTALGVEKVNISDSKKVDSVNFGTSTLGSTYDADFSIALDVNHDSALNVSSTTAFSGSHALDVACHYINVAALLSSQTGGITLDADDGVQTIGIPAGVVVTSGGQVTTAGGNISLSGRGGDNAAGSQIGVALGGTVTAGDNGAGTYGTLVIVGVGGAVVGAGGSNHGVVVGGGVTVSSTGGTVSITGTGSSTNSGDHGVVIDGTVATLTGGLAAPGDIEIIGYGGGGVGTIGNYGVLLSATSKIQTVAGNLSVTGHEGVGDVLPDPPFTNSPGIVALNSQITSTTGNLAFTSASFAADISKGGIVSTTGIVAIRNLTAGQEIGLSPENTALLGAVKAGTIILGRPDLLPKITQDPAPEGALTLQENTNLEIYGSSISLKADITTKGGTQTYNGPVSLLDDVTLTGAGVSFEDAIDGAANLEVNAAAGAVKFAKAVGASAPLASLTISAAASVTASSTIAIDGSPVTAKANGLVIAAGVNNVDIQQAGSVVKNAANAGIYLGGGSTGSTLSGFTLSANGMGVIAAAGAYTDTKLTGNTISKNTTYGVSLSDATALVIGGVGAAANTFTDNKTSGVYAGGTCTATKVIGNTISGGGTLSDGYYGVALEAAQGLVVGTATSGEGNTISGVAQGVYATGDLTDTTVAGNTIEGNVSGIVLANAANLLVNGGNTVKSNSTFGLYALGTSTGTKFQGNTIDGNGTGYYGAYLDAAQDLTLGGAVPGEENTITGTKQGVCGTGDLTGTTVTGNTIEGNVSGIVLASAANLLINGGNTVKSNSIFGLYALGTNTGTQFQGNTIDGNGTGYYGAYLDAAQDLTLGGTVPGEENTITGTKQGVCGTGDLTGTTVAGNTIEGNVSGIVLSNAANLLINGGNTVKSSTIFGLYALGTNTGTQFQGNTIDGNGTSDYGAYLDAAQDLTVGGAVAGEENLFTGAKQGICGTGDLTGTTVSGNAIEGNVSGIVLSSAANLLINGGNAVKANSTFGLYALGTNTATKFQGNTIDGDGTGYYGAYLDGAQSLTLGGTVSGEENTILNTQQGVFATGTLTNTTVRANSIQNNVSGLVLVSAQGITVTDTNDVTSNTGYGLYATGVSTDTTVTGNTITGNLIDIETSTAIGGTFQTS